MKIEVGADPWAESEKQPSNGSCNGSQRGLLLAFCVSVCLCDSPSDVTKESGVDADSHTM